MGNVDLLITFTLAAAGCVLALRLFHLQLESSWPLAYAAVLFLYYESHTGILQPSAVYAVIVCTLLLRFEFLSRALERALRVILLAGLVFNGWTLFTALGRGLR